MNMRIIGIDPGLTGAIAVVDYKDGEFHFCMAEDMPTMQKGSGKKREVNGAGLRSIIQPCYANLVVLERVGAITKPGEQKQGVVGMFSFGDSFGCARGVVQALGIPLVMVTPPVWKRNASLIGKDKEASRSKAIQLFPEAPLARKKDSGRAEALLIARFGSEGHTN